MNKKLTVTIFICLSLFMGAITVMPAMSAQYYQREAYELYVTNEFPSPGERVNISIQALEESLGGIRAVEWYVDGEPLKEFRNKLKMNNVINGSPKEITAEIVYFSDGGQRKYMSVTQMVRPVIFDIFWESDVVTTALYRGHKLAGPQTPVRISAHMQYIDGNGALHTEKDFSFVWEIESRYQDEQGLGVSALTYNKGGSFLNSTLFIRARATLIDDRGVSIEKITSIPIVRPRLLVYPYTLLNGLSYDIVVPKNANIVGAGDSVTFSVYPFYFSKSDFDRNAVQYKWFVNNGSKPLKRGRKIDISIDGSFLSIPLKILVENENKKQQKIQNSITLNV